MWRVCLWIIDAPVQWVRFQKEIPQLAEVAVAQEQELAEVAGRMWLETQLFPYKPRHVIRNADRDHGTLTATHTELIAKTFGRSVWEEEWFQRHEKAFLDRPQTFGGRLTCGPPGPFGGSWPQFLW